MSKVISMSDEVYPVLEMLEDIKSEVHDLSDLLAVLIDKDGNATVLHTGLPLAQLTLAATLIQYEAFTTIDSEKEVD